VGAESPAIWPSYAASQNANPTAFDSAADWSAHDVVGHIADLGQMPVLIECGDTDPFIPASRQLATLLKPGDVVLSPGGHDITFWKSNAAIQMKFLST
jgi:pimeloyl-ACP methyl ester carboxylesterase